MAIVPTRKPPVEAALFVTYLQFPIQVCFPCIGQPVTNTASVSDTLVVFGRPFVKRFALCYQTVVCPVLSVCL